MFWLIKLILQSEYENGFHNKYSADANQHQRRKRATASCNIGAKNTCYLYLRADPQLYNQIKSDLNGVKYFIMSRQKYGNTVKYLGLKKLMLSFH